jgi:hypothetical protein
MLSLHPKINAALVHGCLRNLQLMYVHFKSHDAGIFIQILQGGTAVGQIIEILSSDGSAIVSLDIYQVASTRHDIFGMPTLARRHDETSILILPAIVSSVVFGRCVILTTHLGHGEGHLVRLQCAA